MTRWFLCLLVLTAAACQKVAYITQPPEDFPGQTDGRTRVGNGGDDVALRGNAWFLGDRPIRTCLENGTDLTDNEVRQAMDEAFFVWRRYLTEKKVNLPAFHPERRALPPTQTLGARHEWVPCSDPRDLRIAVGTTTDPQLNWERLEEFPGKSAFVVRRSFDLKEGWAQGDMWIASPNRLEEEGLSLKAKQIWIAGHGVHELGHVLGCGHVPNTIMAKDFVKTLTDEIHYQTDPSRSDRPLARMVEIGAWPDQQHALFHCENCTYHTELGYHTSQWGLFGLLFGDDKIHEVSPLYQLFLEHAEGTFRLHFSSGPNWAETVSLTNVRQVKKEKLDTPVFKVAFQAEGEARAISSYQTRMLYEGTLSGNWDGERLDVPMKININGPNGILSLQPKDQKEPWLVAKRLRAKEKQP